ncbi:hypothetical protein WJX72_005149 [[Myrmecia] bisecta]|uniref:Uncharacterized protein n=1 Tax=[Myrmecia] bisecta TaxID=41462 RepID=A0AAW1PH43_9CHLO
MLQQLVAGKGQAFPTGRQLALAEANMTREVREAMSTKCCLCKTGGASIKCSAASCKKRFHLPCALRAGCSMRHEDRTLACMAHAVLGGAPPVADPSGQALLQGGRKKQVRRKAGADKDANLRATKRARLEALAAKKARQAAARPRRGWKSKQQHDAGSDDETSAGDELSDSASDADAHDDDSGDDAPQPGTRRSTRQHSARQKTAATQRLTRSSKLLGNTAALGDSSAEVEEERAEDLPWVDAACMVCHSKDDQHSPMIICDTCNAHGLHLACSRPPLTQVPPGEWHCSECASRWECEHCGKHAKARGTGGLVRCTGCGARCHTGCMADESPQCQLCQAGLQVVAEILGCRPDRRQAGSQQLEYYVRWAGRSYRHCSWVGATTIARISSAKQASFHRTHRGAHVVEPEVQESWTQVERCVAVRAGGQECLVKWCGLDYSHCSWEPAGTVDAFAIRGFEQCQKLGLSLTAAVSTQVMAAPAGQHFTAAELLEGMEAQLAIKDYQVEGINWLVSQLQAGRSCILGDEMGLGKTIQAAVMLRTAQRSNLLKGPVIVVAPLSTVGSWERELRKWAGELEVLSYIGAKDARACIQKYELLADEGVNRSKRLVPRFHIMLTTPQLVHMEERLLRQFDWSVLLVDEGHNVKNESSQLRRDLQSLQAGWRLLLTGTPLQNELRELFGLLGFLDDLSCREVEAAIRSLPAPACPGSRPDEEGKVEEAAYIRQLHTYLQPRMLRRLKHNILSGSELPPKITRKVLCPLSVLQRRLYADILARNFAAINAGSHKTKRASLNNVLMALRKACDHPYLFDGQEPKGLSEQEALRMLIAASGKLAMLQRMLPRLITEGHRILIFCQLKDTLTLLEDFLHDFEDPSGHLVRPAPSPPRPALAGDQEDAPSSGAEGGDQDGTPVIPCFRLDGETKQQERQRMIDEFNAPDCPVPVFLMSTRAGGLGINVQSADTVIIYDADFNPFVDQQAEGRAHRLGQASTVMVYQLVTPNSVEEQIMKLGERKKRLEALVTTHLGRSAEVSTADLRTVLLHGAASLMDNAACIKDALLGEVREGVTAGLGGLAAPTPQHPTPQHRLLTADDDARMLELLRRREEHLRQMEAETYGRGQRKAARDVSYAAEPDDGDDDGGGNSSSDDSDESSRESSPGDQSGSDDEEVVQEKADVLEVA